RSGSGAREWLHVRAEPEGPLAPREDLPLPVGGEQRRLPPQPAPPAGRGVRGRLPGHL
ncbi:hypothetical protein AVEN_14196-1, partial [Araneus ventricosus]